MGDQYSSKTLTARLRIPNPLFEKWLLEWHLQEAKTAGKEESMYSKALASLKKFPLVLKSGLECIILEHFDETLCYKLQDALEKHNDQSKGAQQSEPILSNPSSIENDKQPNHGKPDKPLKRNPSKEPNNKSSPKRKSKSYIPAKRSAAYALLMALLSGEGQSDYPGFMTKAELLTKGQAFCDVSLKRPAHGSYYTGWSSMTQLLSKGLVSKYSNPAKFSLTEKGRELAITLKNDLDLVLISQPSEEDTQDSCCIAPLPSLNIASEVIAPSKTRGRKKAKETVQDIVDSGGTSSQSQEFDTEEMIFLPSSFEIYLLVDTAETAGAAKREGDEIICYFNNAQIKYEVRHLKVGDYVWVARDKLNREMVLPYIVERKRLDDLGSSIKDGRFHEQKFRIKQSGLPNRIYLVEESGLERNGIPRESIEQAIANTMVCDKFLVKRTENLLSSVNYLARMTKHLTERFKNKTLFSCKKEDVSKTVDLTDDIISLMSFADFSKNMGKIKALSIREIFSKQLLQLHGVSSDKAWAITSVFESPCKLIEGFLFGNGENVIAQLCYGLLERRIGPQIASVLKNYYTLKEFPG